MSAIAAPPAPAPAAPPAPMSSSAELEAMFQLPGSEPAAQPAPEAPKPAAPAKPAEKQPAKEPDKKPEAKEPEIIGDDLLNKEEKPKAPDEAEEKFTSAPQLRNAYELKKKEAAELRKQLEEKSKPQVDPEKEELRKKVEEFNKRFEEVDGELKYARYEKSAEYKEKYAKPTMKAIQSAEEEITQLLLSDENGERAATVQDFSALVNMPLQDAVKKANEWFGVAATEVLAHRRRVVDLVRQGKDAIEEYKKKGSEIERQTIEQQRQHQEMLRTKWKEESETIASKFPQWFGKDESDPEGNAVLEKGMKLVDMAYNDQSGLAPEQMLKLHAVVRFKAGAFDRLAFREKKKTAELESLKAELAKYKASEPDGRVSTKPQGGGKKEISVDEALAQLANS